VVMLGGDDIRVSVIFTRKISLRNLMVGGVLDWECWDADVDVSCLMVCERGEARLLKHHVWM